MPNIKRAAYFFVFGVILVLVVEYFLTDFYSPYGNKIASVGIGDHMFSAEVVSTPDKLAKGLGKRKKLCDSCAMLFVFQKAGRHSFWMKDMLFPIDIIWIKENRIAFIEKNVQTSFDGVLTPKTDADAVLEINAGKTDELGFDVGDEIMF